MNQDHRLISERFPRSSRYHPDWILAGASGGANALWLTEWLSEAMSLQPGMKVLDLGCGRAMSSIFLRREFGVQVWATDLWFNASENFQRIRDAGVEDGVFPIHADARALPFAAEFFDAIVSIDSFLSDIISKLSSLLSKHNILMNGKEVNEQLVASLDQSISNC